MYDMTLPTTRHVQRVASCARHRLTAGETEDQMHIDRTISLQDAALTSKVHAIATLYEAWVQCLRQAMSGVNSNSFAAGCTNTHALVSAAAMVFHIPCCAARGGEVHTPAVE